MKLSDYDFYLPEELIAQHPAQKREESRLLVYKKSSDLLEHYHFYELENLLREGDTIIINNSKVIPARMWVKKIKTNKKTEFFWLEEISEGVWKGLMRGRNQVGTEIELGDGALRGKVISKNEDGTTSIVLDRKINPYDFVEKYGKMPLPPYIKRMPEQEEMIDKERYQTVYAQKKGSVAAPTAGLHFSQDMMNRIKGKGIKFIPITLHVGWGTFKPLNDEILEKRKLHHEYYEISKESADQINESITKNERVIVVGTTTARTIESAIDDRGLIKSGIWKTDLFVYPGYRFKIVKNLITNFHLPKSSLLMLVSALIGREKMMSLYQIAISERYRFFSYGDAMLILEQN